MIWHLGCLFEQSLLSPANNYSCFIFFISFFFARCFTPKFRLTCLHSTCRQYDSMISVVCVCGVLSMRAIVCMAPNDCCVSVCDCNFHSSRKEQKRRIDELLIVHCGNTKTEPFGRAFDCFLQKIKEKVQRSFNFNFFQWIFIFYFA